MEKLGLNNTMQKLLVLLMTIAIVFSFTPFSFDIVYGETVTNYDADKAISYAKEHYNDGGTTIDPTREDCTQFLRECLEAGGVIKDTARQTDGKPYGYTVEDYMDYLVSNGYAETFELTTEKQNWSTPQWYVKAEDNKGILSEGDGIAYYCNKCKTYYHMSINTGTNGDGFVLYHAQNPAAGGDPLCKIDCSQCGASRENISLYSVHITSSAHGYSSEYNDITVSNIQVRRTGDNTLSLKWDAVAGAAGYKVFIKNGKDSAFNIIYDVKSTSLNHTEAVAGNPYYFAVRPYFEKDGKVYVGKLSNTVYNNEYLLAPKNVKAVLDSSTGMVKLTWDKSVGADGYEVYRATSENGTYTKVFELEGTSFNTSNLVPGTTYFFKVKAINKSNSDGNSDFSSVASIKTDNLKQVAVKTSIKDKGIFVTWEHVKYANKYEIYRATSENGTYAKVFDLTGNTYTTNNVSPGQVYYFKVKAINNDNPNASSMSEAVKQIAKMSSPSVSKKNDNSISWNSINGADKYEVYRGASAAGTFAKIATLSGTEYKDTSAASGKTYYYKVKAISDLDEAAGSESTVISVTYETQSKPTVVRYYGNDRYDTAIEVAKSLMKTKEIDKFDNIIVADGRNYADALAGSYLAKVKDAPILLVGNDTASQAKVKAYISSNIKAGGQVYILGGEGAVSKTFEKSLSGYKVNRLEGKTRFETNIEILKEAGVKNEDILICNGMSFADSLSASAVGKPILLVDKQLSSDQKVYLKGLSSKNYYIIGGTGAVSNTVYEQIKSYGNTQRVYGQNRYSTSVAVANKFFGTDSKGIMLAYGLNFPDGLSGGPLAMELNMPLILATTNDVGDAKTYAGTVGVDNAIVLGGTALISDKAVNSIF